MKDLVGLSTSKESLERELIYANIKRKQIKAQLEHWERQIDYFLEELKKIAK